MVSERDFEWIREQVLALRDDVTALKAWRDNQNTQYSRSSMWVVASLTAAISIIGIVVSVWINTR